MTKFCPRCGIEKPVSEFHKAKEQARGVRCWCKSCQRAYQRDWSNNTAKGRLARNRSKEAAKASGAQRFYHIKHAYGLSREQYLSLVDSKQACEICSQPFSGREPFVDHDHATGIVRGLLCSSCNKLLGNAKDRIKTLLSAVDYLRRTTESQKEVGTIRLSPEWACFGEM